MRLDKKGTQKNNYILHRIYFADIFPLDASDLLRFCTSALFHLIHDQFSDLLPPDALALGRCHKSSVHLWIDGPGARVVSIQQFAVPLSLP